MNEQPDLPVIFLWKDSPPGSPPDGTLPTETKSSSNIQSVSAPRLIVHKPSKPNGAAALVISGGGYFEINVDGESNPTANWLASLGVTAFELIYRLPNDKWNNGQDQWVNPPFVISTYNWHTPSVVPIQDALQAMTVIRGLVSTDAHKTIDPKRFAVIGYSAGGHLAGMLATGAAARLLGIEDTPDQRPNFAALIYPVLSISLKDSEDKFTQAYRHLLQPKGHLDPTTAQIEACSVEQQVDASTPPTFLAQCQEDPISPIANTTQMHKSLQQKGIPTEMHVFQCAKHGWGLGTDVGPPVSTWPHRFVKWGKANGFLDQA